MKATTRVFLVSTVLLLGGSGGTWAQTQAPAPGGRPSSTEGGAMLASIKNFDLLLASSKSSLHVIPGSRYPTHEFEWYRDAAADLSKDVAGNANPDADAFAGFQKRYDVLKQSFVDQMYDACPACYNRDRRVAIRVLQLKQDEAIVIDRARNKDGITPAQAARLDRLSERLDGVKPDDVWEIKRDLGMTSRPMTTVATDSGQRSFRDQLRYAPRLPTAGPRAAANEPPPPIEGPWRPNQWVSKANWSDYQQLVPWLNNVLEKTGTADLMRSVGIKPLEYTMALISTESSFFRKSASGAGAYGYMQTLSGTAKNVLRGAMDNYRDIMGADRAAYAALDPSLRTKANAPQAELTARQINGQTLKDNWKTNVFVGVTYLKQHVEEFSERLRKSGITDPAQTGPILQGLIAAAYNAGEGRVRQYWRRLDVAVNDSTQSIVPFRETRNYVRKIAALSAMEWVSPESAKKM